MVYRTRGRMIRHKQRAVIWFLVAIFTMQSFSTAVHSIALIWRSLQVYRGNPIALPPPGSKRQNHRTLIRRYVVEFVLTLPLLVHRLARTPPPPVQFRPIEPARAV